MLDFKSALSSVQCTHKIIIPLNWRGQRAIPDSLSSISFTVV